ncbi:Peptidoglycan/xylan/chitin deacetylase, PgdA/CDA1 family [Paenibacillus sp. GP183]|jgi:peptidoglycan/xylan/chitin deacetylase (PgdA/CDA1 family)|nr:Peptidoglycan/xylan/chitin deacetylase, PgdA/CDA1 family [Paenibacillus sp. GP183]
MRKASLTLIALTMLLSACTGGAAKSTAGSNAASSTPMVTASTAPTNTTSPASTATAAPSPSPEPSPAGKEVAKTYHMNKIYDIVPNDSSGNKKVVLLTFDDGPKEKEMNESLIATLKKHKASAIFFLNGYRIKQKPEILKLLNDSGMTIGNHSWDHIDLKKVDNPKVDQQVGDVQKIVKDLTGSAPQFFRPPFGLGSSYLREKVSSEHMLYMTWSNGSKDWEMTNAKNEPAKVVENVLSQLHPGSNILMHELPWTVSVLDELLTKLEEKGYSFVDPRSIELEAR